MSNCPRCNYHLRLTDWKPNCPKCGVNLMFHGFEERFYEDAKLSELSLAGMRAKMKRFKASFAGGNTVKLRLFTCLLPLASLLLPLGRLSVKLPFAAQAWEAGILGVAKLVMGMSGTQNALPYLQAMMASEQAGRLFTLGSVLLALTVLAAALGLLSALTALFSFVSFKRMTVAAGVLASLGALTAAGGFVVGVLLHSASNALGNAHFSGALGFGAPLAFFAFGFVAAVNFLIAKKGMEVRYEEGDFERAQIYHQVKRGEIDLKDLPYPVVETEATRELEAEIQKEIGGVAA